MPNVQTITLSRKQYKYLYDEAAPSWFSGTTGWAQQLILDEMNFQNPDAEIYTDKFCPTVEKMPLGKKILWAVGGILAVYFAFKLLTR